MRRHKLVLSNKRKCLALAVFLVLTLIILALLMSLIFTISLLSYQNDEDQSTKIDQLKLLDKRTASQELLNMPTRTRCISKLANVWTLPYNQFRYVPDEEKKAIAQLHPDLYLNKLATAEIKKAVQSLLGLPLCEEHSPITRVDVFELLRYRYVPNAKLNRVLTLSELVSAASGLNFTKGVSVLYQFNHSSQLSIGEVYKYQQNYADACLLRTISLKYNPDCGDDRLSKWFIRRLLIVAVQRSGTHYTWEMLNRLNVSVHHEGIGPDGAVSWLYAVK